MEKNKSDFYSQLKQVGALTAIPVILFVGPLLGWFAGDWLDRQFRFYPWFTIIGVFVGFGAAIREILRLIRPILENDKKSKST